MKEQNYDFRYRHWQVHRPNRRRAERIAAANEVMLDETWSLGCALDASPLAWKALKDFQDYLLTSMGISLRITTVRSEKMLWLEVIQIWI